MEKKRPIIVTGSAGRIGANVCKRLGEKYPIVGFELLRAIYASKREELIPVDLGSDESVAQAFAHIKNFYGTKIASVIHLAAYYSFSEEHSDLYDKITVKGTERLLTALQDFEVEQFIFTSTMLVHQPTKPGIPITESSPVVPKWDYPLSKVHTEALIHQKKGAIPAVILRIAGVYDNACHSIPISHQIQRVYENQLESRLFAGNIDHGASFIHMDDLVDAIELAVEKRHELPAETILLLGEPHTLSYDTLQRMISRLLFKREFTTFRVPKWIARCGAWVLCHLPFTKQPFIQPWMIPLADDHYELNISQAKRVLNWEPQKNLAETLPIIIADLKRNPKAWYAANQLTSSE